MNGVSSTTASRNFQSGFLSDVASGYCKKSVRSVLDDQQRGRLKSQFAQV